jgi:predicted transcriptional regulator
MRTTIRIDDDLLRQLQRQAQRENASLTQVVNRAIRRGIASPPLKRKQFKQRTFDMGVPLVNLDKALSLAYEWDDVETVKRMSQGR